MKKLIDKFWESDPAGIMMSGFLFCFLIPVICICLPFYLLGLLVTPILRYFNCIDCEPKNTHKVTGDYTPR